MTDTYEIETTSARKVTSSDIIPRSAGNFYVQFIIKI
jgi:hypothetical protein